MDREQRRILDEQPREITAFDSRGGYVGCAERHLNGSWTCYVNRAHATVATQEKAEDALRANGATQIVTKGGPR